MSVDLDAIDARCQAATPGPWALWDKRGHPTRSGTWRDSDEPDPEQWLGPRLPPSYQGVVIGGANRVSTVWEDSVFLAHARVDLPAVSAELRAARAVIEAADAAADIPALSSGSAIQRRWDALSAALVAYRAAAKKEAAHA